MAGIKDYSPVAASNTALFPEGMAPSAVNDGMRQVQADLRDWYNDAQWVAFGDGDGAAAVAYASGTSFTVNGVDVAAQYHAGRRVKAVGALTGTIHGMIASSGFSTNTTVNVAWDSGALQNEGLAIYLSIIRADAARGLPAASSSAAGAVELATQAEIEVGGDATRAVTPAGLAPAAMTWTGAHVFRSGDAGAGEVTAIDLDRASASPAASDMLMALRWLMRDSGGGTDVAAKIAARLLDPAAGSEDAELLFSSLVAGTLAARLAVGRGLYTAGAAGGDKGPDTLNASEVHARGNPLGYQAVGVQAGATYALVQNDIATTVKLTNAAGCTVTLPAIAAVGAGWRVRLMNAGGGDVTVQRAGSDPIDGGGTSVRIQNAARRNLMDWWTDGTSWYTSERSYVSADQSITNGGQVVLAHSLAMSPRQIHVSMICQSAEHGYSVGQEVAVESGKVDDNQTGGHYGMSMIVDGTNITIRFATSGQLLLNSTSGQIGLATNANWRMRIKASA